MRSWPFLSGSRRHDVCLLGFFLLGTSCLLSARARAEDAGVDAGPGVRVEESLDPRGPRIFALIAGTLDTALEPEALFDVALDDEDAIKLESVRIRTLLRAVDASKAPPEPALTRARSKVPKVLREPLVRTEELATLSPDQWEGRLALDRARLAFYSLAPEDREGLLEQHEARREALRPRETDEERAARQVEAERQRALSAARAARSEAQRLVSEELARLIGIQASVAAARNRFRSEREALGQRRDLTLGWQRRAREAASMSTQAADRTYDGLRGALRTSRDDLDRALDALTSPVSSLAELGLDPLSKIPADIPTDAVRERRAAVMAELRVANDEDLALRNERASELLEEMSLLNHERLRLVSYLSENKRAATLGLTHAGWDQANAEARHLLLILRYHRHVVAGWLDALRGHKRDGSRILWRFAPTLLVWLFVLIVFVGMRRRSAALLEALAQRLTQEDSRQRRIAPSYGLRAVRLVSGFRGQLEWLLIFATCVWLLPPSAQALLEVQLLEVILGWSLGGALVVNVINSIAMGTNSGEISDPQRELRLRSLRLVGQVAVAFVLLLLISARLVGEGTIHRWVLSSCWFAGLPVFLLLVRWWRETVFERVERMRRKTPLQGWVLANRTGYRSFAAAMVAAVQLFALGAYKTVIQWFASFDWVRRAHAYLFKREIDRLVTQDSLAPARPLRPETFRQLGPDVSSHAWIACPAEDDLARLSGRVQAQRGGVVAVVGDRGLGKSSCLSRLLREHPSARAIDGVALPTQPEISAALELASPLGATRTLPDLVLLDDAQAFIKPILGGLRVFDEVLELARKHSEHTLWVFALDSVVWPFLRRARDGRPLFDEVVFLRPWSEHEIDTLLTQRLQQAEVSASFESLLERFPTSADELDFQDAVSVKRHGYFRMLWDYARGNPGIALEVFRSSLSEGAKGSVRVRPIRAPDPAELDTLPDSALFILKAVLQLSPASLGDIAHATRLSHEQVQNAVQFGKAHGYLTEQGGRVRVTWEWLRSVVRILERRHLLVAP